MANVKILVMRDGETWEPHYFNDSAKIVELSEADYNRLADGETGLWELDKEGKIISEKDIKEVD